MACWSRKAAISLKHVKIEEKLLWRAYRRSQSLFRTVPSRLPIGPAASPSRRLGVRNPTPKLQSLIISVTAKVRDFKFGRYIQRVHPNTSPLKIWEKRERGRIQGLPNFLEYPLLSRKRVKLRTSNLATSIQTKTP